MSSLKETLVAIEKACYADARFVAEKGKSLSKTKRKWGRVAGYLLQGMSYVHRAAAFVFLGLPQRFIPSPPPEDAFPKKAKIGFSTGEKQIPQHRGKRRISALSAKINQLTESEMSLRIQLTYRVRLWTAVLIVGTAFAEKETIHNQDTNKIQSVVRVGTLGITLMNATLKGDKETDFKMQMIGAQKAQKVMHRVFGSSRPSQDEKKLQSSVWPSVFQKTEKHIKEKPQKGLLLSTIVFSRLLNIDRSGTAVAFIHKR